MHTAITGSLQAATMQILHLRDIPEHTKVAQNLASVTLIAARDRFKLATKARTKSPALLTAAVSDSESQYSGSSHSSYTGSIYTGSSYTGSSYTGSSYTGSSYTGSSYTDESLRKDDPPAKLTETHDIREAESTYMPTAPTMSSSIMTLLGMTHPVKWTLILLTLVTMSHQLVMIRAIMIRMESWSNLQA